MSNGRMLITGHGVNEGWLPVLTGDTFSICLLGDQAGGFYFLRDFIYISSVSAWVKISKHGN